MWSGGSSSQQAGSQGGAVAGSSQSQSLFRQGVSQPTKQKPVCTTCGSSSLSEDDVGALVCDDCGSVISLQLATLVLACVRNERVCPATSG
jgi:ribosomal protein L37AE/L43A